MQSNYISLKTNIAGWKSLSLLVNSIKISWIFQPAMSVYESVYITLIWWPFLPILARQIGSFPQGSGVPIFNKKNETKSSKKKLKFTLPKFNMEPENDGFQKESPMPGCHFQVPC